MAEDANQDDQGDHLDPFADTVIGRRMRAERKRQGISLREVAERVGDGVHLTTIAKLESGRMRVTYDWARRIAAALGTPALEFFIPEESLNQAKAVPVYTGLTWHAGSLFEDAVSHYTAIYNSRDDLVGVVLGPVQPDIESEYPLVTVIIDPEDTQLRHGGAFLFFHPELGYHAAGVFKSDPDRLVPWISAFAGLLFLPAEGVIVAGRIVETQRGLVSRNS
ncbi:helix-turn-helix domain-containing protein [Sphingomonadaceae bacterium OTU29LAMAA1]|nr:helix-turn-helix domain-containing protein [Sphingomonadaceae bacterium OTU29LAMAA1]